MNFLPPEHASLPDEKLQAFAAHVAGTYRVEREIGRGGWGLVFAAHDLRNDRTVAIKLLRGEYAGSVSAERFRREIEILSRLSDPRIVELYDSGDFDGAPWYAMSYVAGETLRQRLDREGQLPIGDSLRIAREVAEALAHAHEGDVVHRDIKPGNILLQGEHVLVADFGIARAITRSTTRQWVSSSGVQIGTPAYMSPEQAGAVKEIDGRSDIYSLGCVLYEMLAGEPPFRGATATALMARHVLDPVPSLSTVRSSLPKAVEDVVYRALAKSPADRFANAREFAQALDAVAKEPTVSVVQRRRPARRALIAAGVGAVLVVGGWSAWSASSKAAEAKAIAAADTTRLVVLPFEHASESQTLQDADLSMRRALSRWSGITLVDQNAVNDAVGARAASLGAANARALALRLRAGRYVRGNYTADGKSVRLHAMLFDVSSGLSPMIESSETAMLDAASLDSALARMSDRLLLRSTDTAAVAVSATGTHSIAARQAYLRGQMQLERWNLEAADSAFAAAHGFDSKFAEASLWLALSRLWAEKDTAAWHYVAEAALAGRSELTVSDRGKVDALSALAGGDRPRACVLWDSLKTREPFDFSAWYGAADCLAKDKVVLPDPKSPSGWRFRSGYHSALVRYRKAFELRPAVLGALRNDAFERVRVLLWTSGTNVHSGSSLPPQSRVFAAYPSWSDDTLSFVPFPYELVGSGDSATLRAMPRTVSVAVQNQRRLFHDIATGWVASSPQSAAAAEALSLSLFLLGEPSAIDTLMRAKALAKDPTERQRVLGTEVWLRVQFALPSDLEALRTSRRLADSLLRARSVRSVDPHTLASMAALTGHAFEAEQIERGVNQRLLAPGTAPVKIVSRSLVILAAFGGPPDSLKALERRVDSLITALVQTNQRQASRNEALGRAAALAFPDVSLASLPALAMSQRYLLSADAALLGHDTTTVRRILADVSRTRDLWASPELSLDAVFPEAWLLSAIGDSKAAIAWIDPTLSKLRVASSFVDPVQAAMLVRAMAFRADLAARTGDIRTARLWGAAVAELWSGADDFLQPLVGRMRRLAKEE